MNEKVVLVDEQDCELGTMDKMQAHTEGRLHRAFSVFLFNTQGEMLLHQRALTKYHCAGLWTNACCSHPRLGETLDEAVSRRLMEELGVAAEVREIHQFVYRAELAEGLIEHEYDYVFVGIVEEHIRPNPQEIANWKFCSIDDTLAEMNNQPELFTPWFRLIMKENTPLLRNFVRAKQRL
jgi:isopentenyl-diphosphate delta-isomerase